MEHIIAIIGSILGSTIVILVTAFIIGWKKRVDRKLETAEKVSAEIKSNYIEQFKQIRQAISDSTLASVKEMNAMEGRLKDFLNENFVQDNICELRHDDLKTIIAHLKEV